MNGRFTRYVINAFSLVVVVTALPTTVDALPRFAARTGAECSKCHVNPTGGGPRNRYGRNVFERPYLPMQLGNNSELGADTEIGRADSKLSAALGGDLRAAYLYTKPGNESPTNPGLNSFFLMQSDLYVTAELAEYVTLAIEQGTSQTEAYGMLHTESKRGWLKMGRFAMPYGLRFPNHRIYVRQQTGFNPAGDYRGLDTGVELGFKYADFQVIGAISNGKPPGGRGGFDSNDKKALWAKAEYVHGGDGLKIRTGLSAASNQAGRKVVKKEDGERSLNRDDRLENRQAGGYLALGLGRFTYTGETNITEQTEYSTDDETLETSTNTRVGYHTYQELSFVPIQGLDLQILHEYRDADTDKPNPTSHRLGGGFELYPLPMFEFKVLYRHTMAETAPEDGTHEVLGFVHFFM